MGSCAGGCNEQFTTMPIEVCSSKFPDGRCKANSVDDCKFKCESRQNCKDFYFEVTNDGPSGVCTMCRDCKKKESNPSSTAHVLTNCTSNHPVCYCSEGFTGEDCSAELCPNHCGGKGVCTAVGCKCDPGYGGRDCVEKVCSGHGVLAPDGTCTCHVDFKGNLCQTPICPHMNADKPCSGHGECGVGEDNNAKCFCDSGFKGAACDIIRCKGDIECSNHGTCNTQTGECQCHGNFTGSACENFCPNNCNAPSGICDGGRCLCEEGFSGSGCELRMCPNDCGSTRGKCNGKTGACECYPGYVGEACENVTECPRGCMNKGKCVTAPDGRKVCQCDDPAYGYDCATLKCPSTANGVCSNNGICQNGTCYCRDGFVGAACAEAECPGFGNCSGHGTCKAQQCTCDEGYGGYGCETRVCPKNAVGYVCSGHGTCNHGVCTCDTSFSGPACNIECPESCERHGRCVNGPGEPLKCNCSDGWKGPTCSERTCDYNCHYPNGECFFNASSGYDQCACRLGFKGPSCGIKECLMANGFMCNQRGICNTVSGGCSCDEGWEGPACTIQSCLNECSGNGRCREGKCLCDISWSGDDCSVASCPRGSNDVPCSNHGTCNTQTLSCDCFPGFAGDACEEKVCPFNCGGHGECKSGLCTCDEGFTGQGCMEKVCPKNCSGHGFCGANATCTCTGKYVGADCSERSCVQIDCHSGVCNNGECLCPDGYKGEFCEEEMCPNDCGANGTCTAFGCMCDPGFSGSDCSIRTCPSFCGNGTCNKTSGLCRCREGYTGKTCSFKACPQDCNGRGTCVDGTCVCEKLVSFGEACQHLLCPNNCSSHGMCKEGKCSCNEGFQGKDCASKVCPSGCNGNGYCDGKTGECLCKQGWVGFACEEKVCPNECSGHGTCLNTTCTCVNDYHGLDCSIPPCPNDCSNHGVCNTKTGKCNCTGQFKGSDCSVSWDAMTNCTLQSVDYCIAYCYPCYGVSRDNYHKCYTTCNAKCQMGCASKAAMRDSTCDRDMIAEPKCKGDCVSRRCANYTNA